MELKPLLKVVLQEYSLPRTGIHGLPLWARVFENGRRLAPETGASLDVVTLFAILHDCQRVDDGYDRSHGQRAADFALRLKGDLIQLPASDFDHLYRACAGHTSEKTDPDITIQTCWDSDRLDLGRVGITPDPRRLCTEAARRRETIRWSDGRATFGIIPRLILDEWGIDLGH